MARYLNAVGVEDLKLSVVKLDHLQNKTRGRSIKIKNGTTKLHTFEEISPQKIMCMQCVYLRAPRTRT